MKRVKNGQIQEIRVKALDDLPVGTEVDYSGTDVPAGWQEVDNPNTYSINETKIGTWIDGKPLYRKVLVSSTALQEGSNTITHNITNLDKIVKIDGYAPFGNTPYFLGAVQSATKFLNVMTYTSSRITVTVSSDWGQSFTQGCVLIIEYTKTTD